MARTDLTQGNSTANAPAYSTASITPGSNRVTLAFVMNVRVRIRTTGGRTDRSGEWIDLEDGRSRFRSLVRRTAVSLASVQQARTPALGPLSFDFGGVQQTLCAWSVFEYDGVTDIAQVKTASGGTPTPAVTLDALADANKSVVVGGVIVSSLFGSTAQVQPGQGLTEIHEQDVAELGTGGSLQTEDRTGGGTTVNWTAGLVTNWAAIALELKAGLSAADALELAKRFEPILYFHAAEKFYPVERQALRREVCVVAGAIAVRCEGFMGRQRRSLSSRPDHRLHGHRCRQGRAGDVPRRQSRQHRIGRAISGFVRLERRHRNGCAERDGSEQEYLLRPQRRRARDTTTAIWRTVNIGITSKCLMRRGCGDFYRPCGRRISSRCSTT